MSATSRELVYQTLAFDSPQRAPRHLWVLPWAKMHHPEALLNIQHDFPDDILHAPDFLKQRPPTQGDPYAIGAYTDEWGCVFENLQPGVVGEVKTPLIQDWQADVEKIRFPKEWLDLDVDQVNRFCVTSECFLLASCCPRPFERLQFLRGSVNLYMDLLMQPAEMLRFIQELHHFYCEQLEVWAKTDVDGIPFMDDWGSQKSLLIDPALWEAIFKPLYKDYIDIIHGAGKKAFMHSDGYTVDIFPHMIELGLDAINSQLFCMGIEQLEDFAGKICFWGEIDRQHLLVDGFQEDIDAAVRLVHDSLWKEGGCIAQCEFGAGAKPENVEQVFKTWKELGAPCSAS